MLQYSRDRIGIVELTFGNEFLSWKGEHIFWWKRHHGCFTFGEIVGFILDMENL